MNSKGLCLLVVALMVNVWLPNVSFAITLPFINEIHYDNAGTDLNEGVEIAGPAGLDLSGWGLLFYNGFDGLAYKTIVLSGIIPNQQNNYGAVWFPVSGLQNGSPDGIAFIDSVDTPIQFLSYEGDFIGGGGPVVGMSSTDIGVREDNPVPDAGYSLQLIGAGSEYSDFSWSGPMLNTPGTINTGQSFGGNATIPEPTSLSILSLGLLGLVFKRKLSNKLPFQR